ncbi:hypothetical protein [Streptomonospora salina]|uniref:Uncharacterized protein n=1 Tax=Streptomonospora salina TaxID=104205 RepID=A0A841E7U7_9ACTN|nr:hypothetical protein [Streptomonospora salina]MBB5997379.1 hypothetical protein [Streptomonospora salina]
MNFLLAVPILVFGAVIVTRRYVVGKRAIRVSAAENAITVVLFVAALGALVATIVM